MDRDENFNVAMFKGFDSSDKARGLTSRDCVIAVIIILTDLVVYYFIIHIIVFFKYII